MTEPTSFEARMAALREHFTTRARREGVELQALAQQMDDDESALIRIGTIAHSLAGAGAIFGLPQVSSSAAALEDAIQSGAAKCAVASQSLALASLLTDLGCQRTP